jgi:formylmethanofuran dehydrogenase subunit C
MHQSKPAEPSIASNPASTGLRATIYREMQANGKVRFKLNNVADALLPALCLSGNVTVQGNAGDYAFAYNDGTHVTLDGNAGFAAGLGIRSGIVQIKGNVGEMAAAYGIGGSVIVTGDAGDSCATELKGADVCIIGNAGNHAGYRMRAGSLVIQGECGEELGSELAGGVIYVLGNVKSVSANVRESRMKEPDRLRLSLILARSNLTSNARNFRVYKPDF